MKNDNEIFKDIFGAIKRGDADGFMRLIAEDSSRLNIENPFGSWLHVAARFGNLEIVKYLVDLGTDVNLRGGFEGGNALNSAASKGYAEVVRFLLSCGSEMDVSEPERNPLFSAILNGSDATVKLLLEKGIDASVKYTGRVMKETDALAFAEKYENQEIIELLKQHQKKGGLQSQGTDRRKSKSALKQNVPDSTAKEVVAYFTQNFGPVAPLSLQQVLPTGQPIAVHVIPAGGTRDEVTLFTTGLSSEVMNTPPGEEEYALAELYIRLPQDWKYDRLGDPNWNWPAIWLRNLAQYPHNNNTWLGGYLTIISNGEPPEPLAPNTQLSALLLLAEHSFERTDGRTVQLYQAMPIYAAERDLELQEGAMTLLQALEAKRVSLVVDINRPSVA